MQLPSRAIAFILNLQLNSEGSRVFVTTLNTKNYDFYQYSSITTWLASLPHTRP
ncbi:MAG: hypothetical protein NHB32_30360 [Fischerella sp. CENA71]|nr:hypothetical protein [Fischerella sp. CENA71]